MQCLMGMPSLANAAYRAFTAAVCRLASPYAFTTKILTRIMQPGMAPTTTTLSNTSLILHSSAAHFLSSAAVSRTLTSMNKPALNIMGTGMGFGHGCLRCSVGPNDKDSAGLAIS